MLIPAQRAICEEVRKCAKKEARPQFVLLVNGARSRPAAGAQAKKSWLGSGTILATPGGCRHKGGIEYIHPTTCSHTVTGHWDLNTDPHINLEGCSAVPSNNTAGGCEMGANRTGETLVMIVFCAPHHSTRKQTVTYHERGAGRCGLGSGNAPYPGPRRRG